MGERVAASVVAVVLLVLGGLGASVGPAPSHPSGLTDALATGSITVAAVPDYDYQPDTFEEVPTNANITVTFTDDDVLPHSFTISSREGYVIPTSDTPTQLAQLFATYPALYSKTVYGMGDQVVGWFLSPPMPGWYEFVCNVSGHFQNGMYGFVAFGENLPSNVTKTTRVGIAGTGISALDAGAIGAILLALVLGLVLWRRRRSTPTWPARPKGP